MTDNNLIKIGLHYEDQIFDLQFSKELTLKKLYQILPDALQVHNIILPTRFSLSLINKPLQVDEDIQLLNYPIGNGDQLLVKKG
ncbi:type VII secretion protein, YukD family [uncultured Lactobacillus sp.]|uniref:type VII secretion protein, YukD family n=1 Tax=uncultured Lactobacillus sp. TaxID=153152 RepID=UPI002637B8CF|nr:type VII secretion protein, YukD family [uncultured Lactobacillus sp.]